MTIREMRAVLFAIDNQDMSVRDLRKMLFNVQSADSELTPEAMKIYEANERSKAKELADYYKRIG